MTNGLYKPQGIFRVIKKVGKIPDFHRLHKSRTTEMNSAELNRKLREEAERSAKNAKRKKAAQEYSRKQQKISEQTRKQMPPQSPARKRREQELKRQAELELKERKRRRKKRGSNVVYYVAIGLILFGIFAVLSVTVLFNTEQIIIVGESDYTDEQIIAASGLQGNENLVRLNLSGTAEKILDKLVSLDSVKVTKTYPSAITITVEKSVPMANFYYGGKNYVISHTGRVMRIGDAEDKIMRVIGYRPADSVILGGFVKAEDEEQDKLLREISDAIEKGGLTGKITSLNITDSIGLKMTYEDRIEIYLGSILQIDAKMLVINELIDNGFIAETEYVTLDVSEPSRAIQRPITAEGVVTEPPVTYETDENGEPIIPADTDENGDPVVTTAETNENGEPAETPAGNDQVTDR